MMRRLVLSQTYRQSSTTDPEALAADPYNHWFARQSRYRLPAEMIRDNAISISGLRVDQVGGASVKPYQPEGYYRHLNFPTRTYREDSGGDQWRRGVYVHWQRQFLHPMLKALDAPSREECTAQRPRSNTPLEALVLLNDPTMVESAMAMASRILSQSLSDHERLDFGFRLATARQPDDLERQTLLELLHSQRTFYEAHPGQAAELLRPTMFRDAEDPVALAAWTSLCRAMLNMYETVTRS